MSAAPGTRITSRIGATAAKVLAAIVVLAAVISMPICHFNDVPAVLDADARTITESRSQEEHFGTPGVFRLHDGIANDDCDTCQPRPAEVDPASHRIEDLSQRVALMPDSFPPAPAIERGAQPRDAVAVRVTHDPAPESPPPIAAAPSA